MCFFIVKYLHAFVWSYNVLLRIWNMTQSESLPIKRAVTLFLLEVGYNEKIAQFLTIECLKKFFCKAGNRDYRNGFSNMPWWEGLIIHVNKNTCLPACIENDFRADADNPPEKTGEQVSVDPDGILSTRTYGLPRNLVFVITNSDRSTRALPLALHSVNRINCIIPLLELQ